MDDIEGTVIGVAVIAGIALIAYLIYEGEKAAKALLSGDGIVGSIFGPVAAFGYRSARETLGYVPNLSVSTGSGFNPDGTPNPTSPYFGEGYGFGGGGGSAF